ncbi:MAG: response regulator transcription factor [Hyphomicrobiales bacterium]|nr:response regulator transcription factor [Hyphomicrobiales bacterium]
MGTAAHILVVDDDREICSLLQRYLCEQGFRVSVARDGNAMEECLDQANITLVVLDVMLPDKSGLDLCRSLRERSNIPIILLTALKEEVDRIIGLELGADDYLCKPFNPRELVARIRAILRRTELSSQSEKPTGYAFSFNGFIADPETRSVVAEDGREIDLTSAEFSLLQAFLERPGRMLSRNQLLDMTQGRNGDPFDRSIDVLVSRLRRKLNDADKQQLLKTQRNGGYQLAARVKYAEPAR